MKRVILLLFSTAVTFAVVLGDEDESDIVRPEDDIGYSRRAYEAGRRYAEQDIRENCLAVEVSGGPPAAWDNDWVRLLRERFQIELRWVAGCLVNYQIIGHERGYNEVSSAEIQRRFGRDVVWETRNEAQEKWSARGGR